MFQIMTFGARSGEFAFSSELFQPVFGDTDLSLVAL